MGREWYGVGWKGKNEKESSARGRPGPYSAEGGCRLGSGAHSRGTGDPGRYGVPDPAAKKIRVVLDNLNTPKPASLYETFEPKEARQIRKRAEFHYTAKHGSWLTMARIEFSVLASRVLRRRIPDEKIFSGEIAALENETQAGAAMDWRFSTEDAPIKMHHLYPAHNQVD